MLLLDAHGAQQVQSPEQLLPVLRELLTNDTARNALAENGAAAIAENRGALDATLNIITAILQDSPQQT